MPVGPSVELAELAREIAEGETAIKQASYYLSYHIQSIRPSQPLILIIFCPHSLPVES
jgi:hypothetical protein